MSTDNLPPGVGKENQVAHPRRRLVELERRSVGGPGGIASTPGDRFVGFSWPGIVTVGMLAPRWYSTRAISYVEARVSAVVAGGGTGSVLLNLNGAPLITVSVLAGENTHLYTAVFSIAPNDFFDAEVTDANGQQFVSLQLTESA